MFRRVLMMVAVLGLIATACGDSGTPTSTSPPASQTTTTATPTTATPTTQPPPVTDAPAVSSIAVVDEIVVDGEGMSLYLFTPDVPGESSNCNGDCAVTWPPLLGAVTAGAGADSALLGTIDRADGEVQATYAGWPLYYFAGDAAPGETNGQGLGDVWWLVDAGGNPIIPRSPSSLQVEAQTSDGTAVAVASVTLPAPGYVVIHGDGGGSPGPVIGHSDLLPTGESVDVMIGLDAPLTASGVVFPMAHIDADGDGVYEFNPPDETVDVPALFEDGSVAVLPMEVTVEGANAAGLLISASPLGDILTDDEGNTLYIFTVDVQGEASNCVDQCAENWPPLIGEVFAGAGVDVRLVGSADREDGSSQVTYNGWPLYYFAGDGEAGDTNGQGVGDVWWVIDAVGDLVQ